MIKRLTKTIAMAGLAGLVSTGTVKADFTALGKTEVFTDRDYDANRPGRQALVRYSVKNNEESDNNIFALTLYKNLENCFYTFEIPTGANIEHDESTDITRIYNCTSETAPGETLVFEGKVDLNRIKNFEKTLTVVAGSQNTSVNTWTYLDVPMMYSESEITTDSDGDGFLDYIEHKLGTDPNDANSVLRVEMNRTDNGNIILRPNPEPRDFWGSNVKYTLKTKNDLTKESWESLGEPFSYPIVGVEVSPNSDTAFFKFDANF